MMMPTTYSTTMGTVIVEEIAIGARTIMESTTAALKQGGAVVAANTGTHLGPQPYRNLEMNSETTQEEYRIPIDWQEGGIGAIIAVGRYLARKRQEVGHKAFRDVVERELGGSESSANKLMAIAAHPIISDPRYAEKLPQKWALLYELQLLPDDKLLAALQNGSLANVNKYDIWEMRGISLEKRDRRVRIKMAPGEGPVRRRGIQPLLRDDVRAQIKVPQGMTLESFVRTGMELEKNEGVTAEEASRRIGIGTASYRSIRAIILLTDRADLAPADATAVAAAVREMNETNKFRGPYALVEPIIDKIWGKVRTGKLDSKSEQKRVDSFMNAVVILYDACSRVVNLEVPYLKGEDVERAIDQLVDARRALADLIDRLNKERV